MVKLIVIGVLTMLFYMTAWYFVSVAKRNVSIVDIAWGYGFALLALVLFLYTPEQSVVQMFTTLLVVIWGVRLGSHIGFRKIGKPEDWRYKRFRDKGGDKFVWLSYPKIFLLQGFLILVIAAPLFIAANTPQDFVNSTLFGTIGLCIWLVGFWTEVISDYQLSEFIRHRKKKDGVLRTGLWAHSRHPNYFGEVTQWWGIWILVASLPYGLWAAISPLTITFLILFVSGIPPLEKHRKDNPQYRKYAQQTSAFIPLPSKKGQRMSSESVRQ